MCGDRRGRLQGRELRVLDGSAACEHAQLSNDTSHHIYLSVFLNFPARSVSAGSTGTKALISPVCQALVQWALLAQSARPPRQLQMLASHPSAKPLRRPPSARLSPPEPRPRGTPQGSVASACSTFFPAPHLAAPAARLRQTNDCENQKSVLCSFYSAIKPRGRGERGRHEADAIQPGSAHAAQ